MASPLELLGLQNGLGPAVTGLQQFEQNDLANQSALADTLYKQQQTANQAIAGQQAQFDLDQARKLGPSAVQAGIAGNEAKVGEANIAKQQQLGEMINQIGSQLDKVPPQQRTQMMQAMAQRVPGIAKDPTFQMLMQTDPNQLPNALKQVGTNILMQTGDQMRKQALQKQGEDARMAQARMEQAAATGRTAMGESGAMARERFRAEQNAALEDKRIAAGKYDKRAQARDPNFIISSAKNYQEAATKLYNAAAGSDDPMEKAELTARARDMEQRALSQATAAVKPGVTIGPDGQLMPNLPMGATQGGRSINPPANTDIRSAVEASGGRYEPDKYDYRINPETGKVQRKAK